MTYGSGVFIYLGLLGLVSEFGDSLSKTKQERTLTHTIGQYAHVDPDSSLVVFEGLRVCCRLYYSGRSN
jgi:hypothetical protein